MKWLIAGVRRPNGFLVHIFEEKGIAAAADAHRKFTFDTLQALSASPSLPPLATLT